MSALPRRLPRTGPRARRALVLAVVAPVIAIGCSETAGDGGEGASGAGSSHEYWHGLTAYPHVPADVAAAPVVVMVPGGSWNSADPSGLGPLADAFAAAGVLAVPVTVRAAEDGVVYPTPIEDIRCAVADAAATARATGIEPELMVLLGHSSGAHLAALAALTPSSTTPECEDPIVDPDAFVGLAGPYDIRQVPFAEALMGAPIDEAPRAWAAANPVLLADRRPELPVLLLHGDADEVVPVSFSTDFGEALRAGGHVTTVRVLPGVTHQGVYAADAAAGPVVEWIRSLPSVSPTETGRSRFVGTMTSRHP